MELDYRDTFMRALHCSAFFIGFSIFSIHAAEEITVVHVVDGDTVVAEDGRRIRLIGINAPESETENNPAQPFSLEARLTLQEWVENKKVNLTFGKHKFDRYGRTLGYLYTEDGRDIQAEIISKGYAVVVAFPPNIENLQKYLQLEAVARKKKIGLWSMAEMVKDISRDEKLSTGFAIVRGTITKTRESRKNKHLIVNDSLFLLISHERWQKFWADQSLEDFKGKDIEVRGWIVGKGKFKWLVIQHPSILVI